MKKPFQRAVSAALVCLLLLFCAAPAFAAVDVRLDGSQIPMILVGGDGSELTDENNSGVFRFINFTDRTLDSGNLQESVMNVVKPLLVQGLLTNNFQPYYDALYQEVAELFSEVLLDENGDPKNGSGIHPRYKEEMQYKMHTDTHDWRGYYDFHDYEFWYDWRLDPLQTAEEFHTYIEGVKRATGHDKVIVNAHCVGSAVVFAYIAKYGTDSIYGLGLDGVTVNGAEPLSESISGKFSVNGAAVNRLLIDLQALGFINVDSFLNETLDLAVRSGVLDTATDAFKLALYYRIVQGATSALALSTFFSCPMYWSAVAPEDFETAKQYVFGPEGSEKRAQYAGLIKKIDAYHDQVAVRVPQILQSVKDAGANVCVISKYGYQMISVSESADLLADQITSVKRSSFGATTSLAYDCLPDAYVARQVAAGKGKYISPDLQIDASTCQFPDYTFFVKGARHSNWTDVEDAILYTVTSADRQLTVDDLNTTQFLVVDNETRVWAPMTEENCNTYNWDGANDPSANVGFFARLRAYFRSLRTWLDSLFRLLKNLMRKNAETAPAEG